MNINEFNPKQPVNLLVALFDLTRFAQFSRKHTSQEIFALLSDHYEFVGDIIEGAGGKVVKFIGDAALIIFSEADVEDGVIALHQLKQDGDAWLAKRNISSKHIIKAHFGPVTAGFIGTRTEKRFDVFGQTVNTMALLPSNGFAMTPQVFRKLSSQTRKLFKKHTPPVTYIPVDEPH